MTDSLSLLTTFHLATGVIRYSAIAPLILPACAAYFALASVVYRRSWQNLQMQSVPLPFAPMSRLAQWKSLAILAVGTSSVHTSV